MRGNNNGPAFNPDDVVAAKDGCDTSWGRVVAAHRDMVESIAASRLKQKAQGDHPAPEVHDAASDVFNIARRRLDSLQNPRAFPGWLKRLATSELGKIAKKEEKERSRVRRIDVGDPGRIADISIPDPANSLLSREYDAFVIRALDSLDEIDRSVVVPAVLGGKVGAELAREVGMNVGRTNGKLHRALDRLSATVLRLAAAESLTPEEDCVGLRSILGDWLVARPHTLEAPLQRQVGAHLDGLDGCDKCRLRARAFLGLLPLGLAPEDEREAILASLSRAASETAPKVRRAVAVAAAIVLLALAGWKAVPSEELPLIGVGSEQIAADVPASRPPEASSAPASSARPEEPVPTSAAATAPPTTRGESQPVAADVGASPEPERVGPQLVTALPVATNVTPAPAPPQTEPPAPAPSPPRRLPKLPGPRPQEPEEKGPEPIPLVPTPTILGVSAQDDECALGTFRAQVADAKAVWVVWSRADSTDETRLFLANSTEDVWSGQFQLPVPGLVEWHVVASATDGQLASSNMAETIFSNPCRLN